MTDYAGNGGSYSGWWDMSKGQSNSMDGVFVPSGNPCIDSSDITDGTSCTLLIGEKWLFSGWYNDRWSGGGSCIDNEGWCEGWDNDTICTSADSSVGKGGRVIPPQNDIRTAWVCGYVFGSAHTTGMNIALCDGSGRFLNYVIDPAVWTNLCCRNDGVPLTLP